MAIANLKQSGVDISPGSELLHGHGHDDSFPAKHRNYAAGIAYLKLGDQEAKSKVVYKMTKKRKSSVSPVTRFIGESSGRNHQLLSEQKPSQTFRKVDLQGLGAALREQDIKTPQKLPSKPNQRVPFSITQFDSSPNDTRIIQAKKSLFLGCEEITTIDWDCLKSVTFDSSKKEIDIKIPDSAVTQVVKVTK